MSARQVVGVDGCPAGWFWVRMQEHSYDFGVSANIEELCATHGEAAQICIDIPIGLPSDIERRRCDSEARRLLGPRAPSVFSAPCRQILDCESYEAACSLSRASTGRALSRQGFAIVPKIREVDTYLRAHRNEIDRVVEVHPEVCFQGMSGKAMTHPKKRQEGNKERLAVLDAIWPLSSRCFEAALAVFRRAHVSRDDIIDAIACALTARDSGPLNAIPNDLQLDDQRLPMRMICYKTAT